jgi:hypothetical protein
MLSEDTSPVDEYDYSPPRPIDLARWEEIRNKLIDEMEKGKSLTSFAEAASVDIETLDHWLTDVESFPTFGRTFGKKTQSELIADALDKHLEGLAAEKLNTHDRCPVSVETSVTKAIGEGISTLRAMCEMSYIDAPPGAGKTEGIKQYISRARKAEGFDCPVWKIVMTENTLTPKAVLSLIAWEILGGDVHGDKSDYAVARAIQKATNERGGVLLIDEAQHLGDADKKKGIPIINALRSFSDGRYFGVVLFGNGEIYRRLKGGPYTQITSRADPFRVEIAGLGKGSKGQAALTEQDVVAVMNAWGVKGADIEKWCMRAAQEPGALRYMTSIFRACLDRYSGISLVTLNRFKKF